MRRAAWFFPFLLAACSAGSAAPSTTAPTERPSQAATAPQDSPAATATDGEPAPIGSALPATLTGVELHTFEVGQDVIGRLADALGVPTTKLEVAFASDHGARFVQMYALRLPGTDAASLAATWAAVAFPPEVTDVSARERTLADRTVTAVETPSMGSVGTFYLDPRDDTLFVVQAFDVEVAAEALAAIP